MAVVFLWRLRLQVVPLGTSYSLGASCVMRQKNFRRAVAVTINGITERGNTPLALCLIAILHFVKEKRFVERRHLRVTVLALFYESVNRLTETKGWYTRGSLLPQQAPATRSRSKAFSSAPTISSEKIC